MTTPTGAALASLPPIDRPCRKCGSEARSLMWIPAADDSANPLVRIDPREYMRVTCDACGFVWAAAPADAGEA